MVDVTQESCGASANRKTPGRSIVLTTGVTVFTLAVALATFALVVLLNALRPNELVAPIWIAVPLSLLDLLGGLQSRALVLAAFSILWLMSVPRVPRLAPRLFSITVSVTWTLASIPYLAHLLYY